MRLLGFLLVVAACQGGSKASPPAIKDAPASEPGPTVTRVVQPEARLPEPPPIELPLVESFKLLSPGAAPRSRLRYTFVAGTHQVVAEARIKSRRLGTDGWSASTQVPPFEEGFEVSVSNPGAGQATLLLRGLPASTDAGEASARWKALVENKRGQATVDDRGRFGKVTLAQDPGGLQSRASTDEITQRWLTATIPLPEAAIGKGARWKVVTVLRAGDSVVKQTVEYVLVERSKKRWIIDVTNKRVAEQQMLVPAGMPRGSVAELIALFRQLQGRLTVTPDLPWPVGEVTAELRVHGRVVIPGQAAQEHVTEDTGTIALGRR